MRFLNLILALVMTLGTSPAYGDAVIFSGNDVKALKQNIDLNGQGKILSGTVDPTSSATSAPVGALYLNTSNGNTYRKLDAGSTTNWSIVGSGGDTGTNYIRNGNAQVGTTGWATYADAAGAVPVDCTGGSPSTTFTRSTSSPLDAANSPGSFIYTHGASNLQGEGASYAFTISDSDKAKVLSIEFEQLVDSGTFAAGTSSADSDVTVYIYDVTNSTLIYPSTSRLYSTSTTLTEKFKSTFQTPSNSSSYRLCLHNAKTTATAFALKLGRIKVSPTTYVYGTPVTDWKPFTMVIGASITPPTKATSPAFDLAAWRRVGDSVEFRYNYRQTSASGAAAGSGTYLFPIPGGCVADTAKVAANNDNLNTLGDAAVVDNASGSLLGSVVYYNTTNVSLTVVNSTAITNIVGSGTYGALSGATTAFAFTATVPCVGWSSSVQMSQDTDTRIVAARIHGLNGVTATTTGGVVKFFTTAFDTHGAYSASTGLYTVQVPGIYRVTAGFNNSSAANSGHYLYLGKNGNSETARLSSANLASGTYSGSSLVQVNAGDTLGVYSSSNGLALADGTSYAYVNYERLTGPAAIAATETVAARYYGATATITGTASTITYTTKDFDTHGAYSAGTYTVPVPGKYQINAYLRVAGSYTLNTGSVISIYKNGVIVDEFTAQAAGNLTEHHPAVSDILNLVAGDAITIRIRSNATTPTVSASNNSNYLSIVRVGN